MPEKHEHRQAAKEVKEAAKARASAVARDAHEAADEAHSEAKKHIGEAEDFVKPYWDKFVEFVSSVATRTASVTQATVATVASGASRAAVTIATELQNPVVAVNVLLGAASVGTLLNGYAKERRFLKGKSDKDIMLIVSGLSVFVATDAFLSYKYYKKLDKK